MKQHRPMLLGIAWLAYMTFTIAAYPLFGISVLLPCTLLCGFATWFYGLKIGLLTAILSLPYHMLAMMYNLDNLQGWSLALEPAGIVSQLSAVLFVSIVKNNQNKALSLTANMGERIEERKSELRMITEYIVQHSQAERTRMTETLCGIVVRQQAGLLYHSEALMNFLVYYDAPQADAARKLVQLSKENIEEVKNITRKLSPEQILKTGLEQSLGKMCAFFEETVGVRFLIKINSCREISDKVSTQLYRIAHEAVTNAVRHARATHIDLEIECNNNTCTLIIENNGIPFPKNPKEGVGTKLIKLRADLINATIRFETPDEERTRFKCVIPLHNPTLETQPFCATEI
ncbi:MAG: ATP-binding protein [Verrucomicrobiota bacterium]